MIVKQGKPVRLDFYRDETAFCNAQLLPGAQSPAMCSAQPITWSPSADLQLAPHATSPQKFPQFFNHL